MAIIARRPGPLLLAFALGALGAPVRAAGPDLHVDVTPSAVPQEVQLVEHDVDPGGSSDWQIRHGVELAYVLKGDLRISIAGAPSRIVHAGDSFEVPRDTPHVAVNLGQGEAALIISYLMDKGAPQKIPVAAPRTP